MSSYGAICCPIPPLSAGMIAEWLVVATSTAESAMTPEKNAERPRKNRPAERANLDRQYGNIGISAVAAALPYQGDGKNPAYAPAKLRDDERFVSAA